MRRFVAALRRLFPAIACACALAATVAAAGPDKKAKPTISLKAAPVVVFAPGRVVLTAELVGGADDYEEFYCPTIEWDWGDDTRTETKTDCDPYEAGKSQIKRRFVVDRVFNLDGDFRVEFRLKQKKKVVGVGHADVKVRPGVRGPGG